MVACSLQQPRSESRNLAFGGLVEPEEYSDSAGATSQIWRKLCPVGTHSRSQLSFSWDWPHLFSFMQEKHFIRASCNLLLGNTGHSWFHQKLNQWVPLLLHTSTVKFWVGSWTRILALKDMFYMVALDATNSSTSYKAHVFTYINNHKMKAYICAIV